MKPDQLVEELRGALGGNLRSVVLYGSAASGDHTGRRSDYNILAIVDRMGVEELMAVSRPAEKWKRSGNPPPLFLTRRQLEGSADVFPIELLDIRESRQVLLGEDVIASIEVEARHLRLILERELKSALIQLKESFLSTGGKPRQVTDLMVDSLSTILVLFRAAVRLFEESAPARKLEALAALARHIPLDEAVFREIESIKEGRGAVDGDALGLFDRYLRAVEAAIERIDEAVTGTRPAAGPAGLNG